MSAEDLEVRVVAALRETADATTVDPLVLLSGASRLGRRRQRRRRVVAVCATAAVVAGIGLSVNALAGTALPGRDDNQPVAQTAPMKAPTEQVPSTSAVVAAVHPTPEFTAPISSLRLNDVPTPPYAVDTPGLAQSPEKVGRDPGRVHFTLPAMSGASSVRAARWSVAEGVETVEIWTPDDRLRQLAVQVQVARTEALLTRLSLACCTWDPIERTKTHEARVRGQVATVEVTTDHNKQANGHHRTMVIWQPAAEVWASVQSFDLGEESVVAMANRVDFTRSVRCVTPLVPTHLPDDLTQVGCSMWLQGAVQAPEALLPQAWTYLADKKDGHDVSVAVLSDAIDATTADWQGSTDDGIKALWYGGEDPHLRLVDFHGLIVDVRPGRDDRELATWIADGLRLSGDPWRPQSWPARLTRTAD